MNTLLAYLPLLALTLAIECAVVWLMTRGNERGRSVATSIFANLITHPAAWLLAWRGEVLAIEAGVVACEWLAFHEIAGRPRRKALWIALAANLASFGAGFVWTRL